MKSGSVRDCVEVLRKANGTQLNGWFGPAASGTLQTANLAASTASVTSQITITTIGDAVRTSHGDLVSVPYSMEINDALYRYQTEGEFDRMIRDAFDVLYAEGEESGRVMAICLHPYLYGQPHRIKHLDRALGYILEHDGVWQATGTQIADWSRQHWLPQLESHFEKFAGERNDA